MILLENYGWNDFHRQNYNANQNKEHAIGRVISIKGFKYLLITEKGELETELSGKLLFGAESENLPKVGDWVYYLDYGQVGYIDDLLPRMNSLARKAPGNKTEKQILAANIDYALIVQGLDRDFNLKRLERYLVQVTACGIDTIVVLNKADLAENLHDYTNEVLRLKRNCKIFACSAVTGAGVEALKNAFETDKTYILIGSSGVGKSSLLNSLINETIQQTSSISRSTNKGSHTTTTRDLFQLSNGSLIIDTPGMREFGLTSEDAEDADSVFPAIDEFAHRCHYSDCTHLKEAGCSVIEAVRTGKLEGEIYECFIKLVKEQKHFETKIEDKKRLGKQFGKLTREANNYRKKYKY